jgi:hypothetical protein
MENCDCPEGFTERTIGRTTNGRIFDTVSTPTGLNQHDCTYIAARNAVLDQAERIALAATERKCPRPAGKARAGVAKGV